MIDLPREISTIIDRIENAGYQAYLVGGSVRDFLLDRIPGDFDLASNAPVEAVLSLFGGTEYLGQKFGVVTVREGNVEADVAAMRIDGIYSDLRRPDQVQYTTQIEEDLARRDFTINGMAYHPVRGLIDPFDGRRDLADKRIRAIGNPDKRFSEDPLRILRGLRFSGQLDFVLEQETQDAMRRNANLLERLSPERTKQEFMKLLASDHASSGLRQSEEAGVLSRLVGGLSTAHSHTGLNSFVDLLERLDVTETDPILRFSLLLLCAPQEEAYRAIERLSFDAVTQKRLDAALNLVNSYETISNAYGLKRFLFQWGDELADFLERLASARRMTHMVAVSSLEQLAETRMALRARIRQNQEPIRFSDLAIRGEELLQAELGEGPEIGRLLGDLLELVHREPEQNTKSNLLQKAKLLHDRRKTGNPGGNHIL